MGEVTHYVAESHIGDLWERGRTVAAEEIPGHVDLGRLLRLGALRPETANEREARLIGASSPQRHGDPEVSRAGTEEATEGAGGGQGASPAAQADDPRLLDETGRPLEGAARAAALRKIADEAAPK